MSHSKKIISFLYLNAAPMFITPQCRLQYIPYPNAVIPTPLMFLVERTQPRATMVPILLP